MNKRTQALIAWATKVRDTYNVHPTFVHTDKDMAEIAMVREVWNAKHQLCSWHLRRAVRERLSKSKLTTTPYRPMRAHEEFSFIDPTFTPPGQADPHEYEGGMPDTYTEPPISNIPNLTIRLPARPSAPQSATVRDEIDSDEDTDYEDADYNSSPIRDTVEDQPHSKKLVITLPAVSNITANGQRIFCPERCRDSVIQKMNRHMNAHPLIPVYATPTAEGIRAWAVKQMYAFCVKHDLRELWAYLWENWYRPGRWELWARAPHAQIPRLKTTMILESQ